MSQVDQLLTKLWTSNCLLTRGQLFQVGVAEPLVIEFHVIQLTLDKLKLSLFGLQLGLELLILGQRTVESTCLDFDFCFQYAQITVRHRQFAKLAFGLFKVRCCRGELPLDPLVVAVSYV